MHKTFILDAISTARCNQSRRFSYDRGGSPLTMAPLDLGRLLILVTPLRFADLIGKFLNRP
jgi:hypothetical protein